MTLVVALPGVGKAGADRFRSRFALEWAARDRELLARTGQQGTCTRADNDGTIVDSRGMVRSVVHGLPRWSAFKLNGSRVMTLLGERTRTNLVTHSEDLVNAAWAAAAGGLPTQTAGQADPMGGTAAVLLNDADTNIRGQFIGVTFGSNGEKVASIMLKKGTAAAPHISLFDNTAAVHRHRVAVTWSSDGVPVLSTSTGGGTLFPPVELMDGWWWIRFTADGILSANVNRFYIYPASGVTGSVTGTVYAFGVQVEDADFPSSYVRTTGATAERVHEQYSWPMATLKVEPLTLYLRFIETGVVNGVTTCILAQISTNDPRLNIIHTSVGTYRSEYYNGSTSTSGGITLAGIEAGDVIELCASLDATGKVTFTGRRNGGALETGASSAIGFNTTWGNAIVHANGQTNPSFGAGLGLLDLRMSYGARTLEEMAA